jgi:hypothetical protein
MSTVVRMSRAARQMIRNSDRVRDHYTVGMVNYSTVIRMPTTVEVHCLAKQ